MTMEGFCKNGRELLKGDVPFSGGRTEEVVPDGLRVKKPLKYLMPSTHV